MGGGPVFGGRVVVDVINTDGGMEDHLTMHLMAFSWPDSTFLSDFNLVVVKNAMRNEQDEKMKKRGNQKKMVYFFSICAQNPREKHKRE